MFKYLFNRQYRFFHRKLYAVQASIWEAEFKAAKSRQVREGVRQDRDRAKEAMNNIDAALGSEKDKDKRKKLEQEKAAFADNVTRYEAQMRMIDDQINGFAGDEKHEPIVGLIEQIKSYTELMLMYKDYMRQL